MKDRYLINRLASFVWSTSLISLCHGISLRLEPRVSLINRNTAAHCEHPGATSITFKIIQGSNILQNITFNLQSGKIDFGSQTWRKESDLVYQRNARGRLFVIGFRVKESDRILIKCTAKPGNVEKSANVTFTRKPQALTLAMMSENKQIESVMEGGIVTFTCEMLLGIPKDSSSFRFSVPGEPVGADEAQTEKVDEFGYSIVTMRKKRKMRREDNKKPISCGAKNVAAESNCMRYVKIFHGVEGLVIESATPGSRFVMPGGYIWCLAKGGNMDLKVTLRVENPGDAPWATVTHTGRNEAELIIPVEVKQKTEFNFSCVAKGDDNKERMKQRKIFQVGSAPQFAKGGMGGGAYAGIILLVLAVVAGVMGAFMVKKRRRKTER